MPVQDTVVIEFGDSVDTDNVIARVDPDPNYEQKDLYVDQIARYFLHMQEDLYISHVEQTSGDYRMHPEEPREENAKRIWFPTIDTVNTLGFIPATSMLITPYGNEAVLTISNRNDIRASIAPFICDISYSYVGTPIEIIPPSSGLIVDEEGQWPVGVVIHLEQV